MHAEIVHEAFRETRRVSVSYLLGRIAADDRELFEIEDGAVDERRFVREEINGGPGDIVGRQKSAGRRVLFRKLRRPIVGQAIFSFHFVFGFRERPADVELLDAQPFGTVGIGKIAREGHEGRPC